MDEFVLERTKVYIENKLVKAYLDLFAIANGSKRALIEEGMSEKEVENIILVLNKKAQAKAMELADKADKALG